MSEIWSEGKVRSSDFLSKKHVFWYEEFRKANRKQRSIYFYHLLVVNISVFFVTFNFVVLISISLLVFVFFFFVILTNFAALEESRNSAKMADQGCPA